MTARPWEPVLPIEEMIVPNRITTRTSHRTPSVAPSGRKEHETSKVMGCN